MGAIAVLFFSIQISAVIFFSTADPQHNTTAPAGDLARSGWELQGLWGPFLGTPIASNYFLTAKHVAGTRSNVFILNGTSYQPLKRFDHPRADLAIWRVHGSFTNVAELYDSTNEVGQRLIVFGRGSLRGDEVRVDDEFRGWHWGPLDGRLRWGENQVHAITMRRGEPLTSTTQLQFLRALFQTNAGPNEAHLSVGDSGGGVFIRENSAWKLVGINSAVDGLYSTNSTGPGFEAALFDERGFYKERNTNWVLQSGAEIQPGGFYATRISAYRDWIDRIIQFGNPFGEVVVDATPTLERPFAPAEAAGVDLEARTAQLPLAATNGFIRLRSLAPIAITSITNTSTSIVLQFEED